jgi:hypothetical protein
VLFAKLSEAQEDTSREEPDEDIEVEEEGRPSCRLVFGDGCDLIVHRVSAFVRS